MVVLVVSDRRLIDEAIAEDPVPVSVMNIWTV